MKKDAYYFSHDANAMDDPKCMLLIDQLGMEGYGIFWGLIERLRQEKDYKLPTMIIPSLAKRWSTSTEKVQTVVSKYGLFIMEDDVFFSERLRRSMVEKSQKGSKSALIRWHGNATAMQPHSNRNAIAMQNDAIKVKESKVKEKKENSNKVFFKNSQFFDKLKFKEALPGWSIDKLKYYYDSAVTWSNEGNKKVDWIATVKNWAARDEKEGKVKFKEQEMDAATRGILKAMGKL